MVWFVVSNSPRLSVIILARIRPVSSGNSRNCQPLLLAPDIAMEAAAHMKGYTLVSTRSVLPGRWELSFKEPSQKIIVSFGRQHIQTFIGGSIRKKLSYPAHVWFSTDQALNFTWSDNTTFLDIVNIVYTIIVGAIDTI